MNKFSSWFLNFMRGRYGFDQFGRALSVYVIVFWIVSIAVGILSNFLGGWAAWLSTILNWIGLAILIYMIFRMLSRNIPKRRAENEAYLGRKQKKDHGSKGTSSSRDIFTRGQTSDQGGYTYLSCGFCNQQMRVPKGKGKIAVKCPSCGEKTIINS